MIHFHIKQLNLIQGMTHIFINHVIQGIIVANHKASVHIQNGHVIASSSSFKPLSLHQRLFKREFPMFDGTRHCLCYCLESLVQTASELAQEETGVPVDDSIPTKHIFFDVDSEIVPAVVIRLSDSLSMMDAYVDPIGKSILQIVNYNSQYSYRAIPLTGQSPDTGFATMEDPVMAFSFR